MKFKKTIQIFLALIIAFSGVLFNISTSLAFIEEQTNYNSWLKISAGAYSKIGDKWQLSQTIQLNSVTVMGKAVGNHLVGSAYPTLEIYTSDNESLLYSQDLPYWDDTFGTGATEYTIVLNTPQILPADNYTICWGNTPAIGTSDVPYIAFQNTPQISNHSLMKYYYSTHVWTETSTYDWYFSYNYDIVSPEFVPSVTTLEASPTLNGRTLTGIGTIDYGELTNVAFDFGTSTGNYTENLTATFSGDSDTVFTYDISNDEMLVGQSYYFRAKAENVNGWGYGIEKTFTYTPQIISVTTSSPNVDYNPVSENSSLAFNVFIHPDYYSANVSVRVSSNATTWANPVDMYLIASGYYASNTSYFTFETWNWSAGESVEYTLLPDTTYYYQGYITVGATMYYSDIKSFTTESAITSPLPDKPLIELVKLSDVSAENSLLYAFEIVGKITTDNNTDSIINQGIDMSQNKYGLGLPTSGNRYLTNEVAPDGTFTMILSLDNADWYSGETLYFRVFITTMYYGELYSKIASITPSREDTDGDGLPDIPTIDDNGDVISSFSNMVKQARLSLHLVGVMGTWAFMGLVILIISLLFGITMIAVPTGIAKSAVGVSWLGCVIAVAGGFIFTGELGIWPIIILTAGTVMLVGIVLSIKLSGGGNIQNG